MASRFTGKRVLVTEAAAFMGPAVCKAFREEGADVLGDERDLGSASAVADALSEAGPVDVLVVNLGAPYTPRAVHESDPDDLQEMFRRLVLPMHALVRGVLPGMMQRRKGKIVVVGSASALRGMPLRATYAAARGAQLAYVKTVALEAIEHNVHVNATAHAFIENPTYYSAQYQATEEFRQRLQQVPIGRLATGREGASPILYLASDDADFMVGQVIACAGGFAY